MWKGLLTSKGGEPSSYGATPDQVFGANMHIRHIGKSSEFSLVSESQHSAVVSTLSGQVD